MKKEVDSAKIEYRNNSTEWDGTFVPNTTTIEICPYLLPCGICERTNKQCPKHWTYDDYTKWTCKVNKD